MGTYGCVEDRESLADRCGDGRRQKYEGHGEMQLVHVVVRERHEVQDYSHPSNASSDDDAAQSLRPHVLRNRFYENN